MSTPSRCSIAGVGSLIGAIANCSSYQKPRRGRGKNVKAGITV